MKKAIALQVDTASSFDTTHVLACLLLLWIIPCFDNPSPEEKKIQEKESKKATKAD